MCIYIHINHVEVWVCVFYQHFNMWIDPQRNISLIAVSANSCRITIKANSAQVFGNQSFHGFIRFSPNSKQMKRETWRKIFPCGANVVDLAYIIEPAIMFLWQKEMNENLRHYRVHAMVFQIHMLFPLVHWTLWLCWRSYFKGAYCNEDLCLSKYHIKDRKTQRCLDNIFGNLLNCDC